MIYSQILGFCFTFESQGFKRILRFVFSIIGNTPVFANKDIGGKFKCMTTRVFLVLVVFLQMKDCKLDAVMVH